MLSVGDFAVVIDFGCCEGFEEGTCVEIIKEDTTEEGLHYYVCKSHSPERQWSDLRLIQCPDCLHPIKAMDACPGVHSEH